MRTWEEHYQRWQRGEFDGDASSDWTPVVVVLLLLILWRVW